MRKFFSLTLGLAFELATMGQIPAPQGSPHKVPKGGYDEDCVHRNTYTEAQRLDLFPFKVSDTIKLVSFRYHNNHYPVSKNHITSDSLMEQQLLSKAEINRLTDIIYNVGRKKKNNIGSVNQCFFPRNAVLFIDKSGKLQAYVLICFHCSRYETSVDDMGSWDDCYQKSEMIRQFFISAGMKFGTDPAINEYPGEDCDD